ncbi:hypothetical protein [Roseovarius sp. THAF9]|uniref:hypothetical protein n=1 Tax=Roseovarius sp. THAF9 TaxID=2587847 RepID=UPI0012689865|nr:hypothetical protein [Roseovarius sp. THAF9]
MIFEKLFKKKAPKELVFKSNEAAFQYACKFLDNSLVAKKAVTALVEDVSVNDENEQAFKVRVANKDGGKRLVSYSLRAIEGINRGDLVLWGCDVPIEPLPIGFVLAKVEPTLNLETGEWKIAS